MNAQLTLTSRQQDILRRVVEAYVSTGQPVGSKALVERVGMSVSASTVRNELAELEAFGLLTHPHTSAGRVPTESGYRYYTEELLHRVEPRPTEFPLDLREARSEVEAALQTTTEMLAQVTRLLALVSAPPLEATTVRHVELLLLQPQLVMVVVITSAGGVTKRIFEFAEPVDPGLAKWGGEYLDEALAGVQLGSRLLRNRIDDPGMSPRERAFLAVVRPAFTELVDAEQRLYVGGAADLLEDLRGAELDSYRRLLELLEKRASLLEVLGESLDTRGPFVRLGRDFESYALPDVALVGACYGLVHRTLGSVSLIGPVRMDYEKAIRSVRAAATELSRFVEDVYTEN
jgi:heat-inducible transcriptional repressor